MDRDSAPCVVGVAQAQPNNSPTLALPLARVFLRVFRIVLLEQMSTIPKVGQISLYAVLRGVQGSGGSKGSEPTQSTGSLSLRLCQEPALPAAQAEL